MKVMFSAVNPMFARHSVASKPTNVYPVPAKVDFGRHNARPSEDVFVVLAQPKSGLDNFLIQELDIVR